MQPLPRIGPFQERLDTLLEEDEVRPRREKLRITRIHDLLLREGFEGSYDAVRRYAALWRQHARKHGVVVRRSRSTTAIGTARSRRRPVATRRCGSASGWCVVSPICMAPPSSRHAVPPCTRASRRSGAAPARVAIERLAEADAFHCIAENRRQGLWKVKGLGEAPLPLFAAADAREAQFSPEGLEPAVSLRPMTDGREVVEDYRAFRLSLRAHPVSFLRDQLGSMGIVRCADLATIRDGRNVEVAGVILVQGRALRDDRGRDRDRQRHSLA